MPRLHDLFVGPVAGGCLLLLALPAAAVETAANKEPAVAKIERSENRIAWRPVAEFESLELSVRGPGLDWRKTFKGSETPVFDLRDERGRRRADGVYQWELRAAPIVSAEVRERMKKAREARDQGLSVDLSELGLPRGEFMQAGSFALADGRPLSAGADEPEPRPQPDGPRRIEGDVEITGDLRVRGTKAFVADDPIRPGGSIVYLALEGPEAGTYLRGSAVTGDDGRVAVALPEHFASVTGPGGVTIQLTPVGDWARLYVVERAPDRIVVRDADGRAGIAFDYLVQGVRRGHADHQPEQVEVER